MKGFPGHIAIICTLALLGGCSSERDSWTSKAYHNTTAHYNGYYYAREEVKSIEKTLWSSLNDDYNRILRLYPGLDSTLAKSYDQEVQEAVKMASLAIQRHPNSKWVDDAYILVGKARLYSLDWGNAIQTFKYVNTKSKDPNARHQAIIQLIRTFTEHREFANGQAAIDFLNKEKLNKTNKKSFLLEKAYFYQEQLDYDNVVRNLTQVAPLLKKKDRPGRTYFIIGQVYQKLGFESEAFNFYRKCLATNPEYEVDFYSRLYLAQVTEISRSKSVNAALKSFRKLLKDSKNKEFKDKIYYELGLFELKQKHLAGAIESFNHSLREGTNTRINGEAYLRLGEIYYDTLRDYEVSSAYYDSAITALPKDYEGYPEIKERQEVLSDFVKNLNTIKWQDSLLYMANLDSLSLRSMIDSTLKANEKVIDPKEAKRKRRRSNRIEIVSNSNNVFSGQDTNETGDWYFGNPSAMALGQTEFQRQWGDIPLEDNWRRSLRASTVTTTAATAADASSAAPQQEDLAAKEPVDPVAAEYSKISRQLPRTEEARQEALGKIEEAYFNLGDIYYFHLMEPENAVTSFLKLLERFPESEYEPEILYKLYLIYKETDPVKSDRYASSLKSKHPTSTYARILINPDYLKESSQAAERQKELYASAYQNFTGQDYSGANSVLQEAFALGRTTFTPNLELLRIMVLGQTQSIEQYQAALEQFIGDNEETELGNYAKTLLAASKSFKDRQDAGGIQYIRSLDEPHFFILAYPTADNLGAAATIGMERFNQTYFSDLGLKTSTLSLNDQYTLILVSELPRVSSALEYIRTFNDKGRSIAELRNHKFHSFVITKDNFDIFYRTKGLDEYLQFFEKNYPTEDP